MKYNLKIQLATLCQQYIEQRISNAQYAINNAKESANDDTKSSAGDKHETGRAMAQLEQEKGAAQLHEAQELQETLKKIKLDLASSTIQVGSIIFTNKGNFFIAIPAGKLQIDDQLFYAISIASPIGMKLKGLSKNDRFDFNGQLTEIQNVL